MDREDSDMREDMTVEVEVIEREPDGVVLARHWTGDGATRHQRAGREWEELTKSACSEVQPMFVSQDSNYCSPWCSVRIDVPRGGELCFLFVFKTLMRNLNNVNLHNSRSQNSPNAS
jgi:hypothetical protein